VEEWKLLLFENRSIREATGSRGGYDLPLIVAPPKVIVE
jgi:hypothetical protein